MTARLLLACFVVAGLGLAGAVPAAAHRQSLGHLAATIVDDGAGAGPGPGAGTGSQVEGRLDLAVADVDRLLDLDRDADGRVVWGEVAAREAEIAGRLLAGISIAGVQGPCRLAARPLAVDERAGEPVLVVPFAGPCPGAMASFTVTYGLMFALDAQHRGILDLRRGETVLTAIATPAQRSAAAGVGGAAGAGSDGGGAWAGAAGVVVAFVGHGMHHIWIGLDHILFVVTLLISAATVGRDGRRMQAGDGVRVVGEAARLVTAFTAAHSVTLCAAALGIVRLPSALVESVIALSIVAAAVNVIRPVVTARLWQVAFVFGLMHGFGFASVLADLTLPADREILALLAFNIGVEIGQLAIVAAALPILLLLGRLPVVARVAMPAATAAIIAIATIWLLERALGLELAPFG